LTCLKRNDVGMKALAFVRKILEHIVKAPTEEKYRHLCNALMIEKLKEKVTSRRGGESLLLLSGFVQHQENGTFAMEESAMDVVWIATVIARAKDAEDALKEEKEEKGREREAAMERSAQKTAAEVVYEEAKERWEKGQDAASLKAEKERLMLELGLLLEKEKGEQKEEGGDRAGVSEPGESDSDSGDGENEGDSESESDSDNGSEDSSASESEEEEEEEAEI